MRIYIERNISKVLLGRPNESHRWIRLTENDNAKLCYYEIYYGRIRRHYVGLQLDSK
uniref:Uncharacterized protein n=1 Tax=Heterorhabditis bacteriophora TaxID=37862 RepID=A0A1I7WIC9_HETBA